MNEYESLRDKERRVALIIAVFGIPLAVALLFNVLRTGKPRQQSILVVTSGAKPGSQSLVAAVAKEELEQRLVSAGASTGGDIEVSLAWNGTTDVDIGLREPSGEMIHASHTRSASGGEQDVDANPTLLSAEGERRFRSGQYPGQENVVELPEALVDMEEKLPAGLRALLEMSSSEGRIDSKFTRKPVEHIYFEAAPKGTYTVYAQAFSWRERSTQPLPITVQVRSRGKVMFEWSGAIGPANYCAHGTGPTQVCQFQIK
jgi:hypothetical protein